MDPALSARAIAQRISSGTERFDNDYVALVSAFDAPLAERLASSMFSLSREELERVNSIVGSSFEGSAQDTWVKNRLYGSSSSSGSFRDTGSIREAALSLAEAWNLPGVTDEIIDSIASGYNGQFAGIISGSVDNPFSRESERPLYGGESGSETGVTGQDAFARQQLRGTDQYSQFFGNKPDGQSEEDYVSRFQNKSQSILGDNNPDAVRAGMKTGDPNSVFRNALSSGAGESSGRFQGRLASLAEAFRSMT
jgi:hypothetical protein